MASYDVASKICQALDAGQHYMETKCREHFPSEYSLGKDSLGKDSVDVERCDSVAAEHLQDRVKYTWSRYAWSRYTCGCFFRAYDERFRVLLDSLEGVIGAGAGSAQGPWAGR